MRIISKCPNPIQQLRVDVYLQLCKRTIVHLKVSQVNNYVHIYEFDHFGIGKIFNVVNMGDTNE